MFLRDRDILRHEYSVLINHLVCGSANPLMYFTRRVLLCWLNVAHVTTYLLACWVTYASWSPISCEHALLDWTFELLTWARVLIQFIVRTLKTVSLFQLPALFIRESFSPCPHVFDNITDFLWNSFVVLVILLYANAMPPLLHYAFYFLSWWFDCHKSGLICSNYMWNCPLQI